MSWYPRLDVTQLERLNVEFEDEEEAERIWKALEPEGYIVKGDIAYESSRLEDNRDLRLPYTDVRFQIPENIASSIDRVLDVIPNGKEGYTIQMIKSYDGRSENYKIFATNQDSYEDLKSMREEIL